MCVMGLVKPGQEFTPDHIETIYHRGNNDGFGLAYVEGERNEQGKLIKPGRVKLVKSMGMAYELKEIFAKQLEKKVPFLFHLRNATAGEKNLENCHPYQILNIDDGDPIDLFMFHNGTMRNAWVQKDKSDSRCFAEIHLRGILRERPSMMYEDGFRYFLSTMIDGNKLMFLDNRERVSIINYELGSIQPSGVWLSTKEKVEPYKPYRSTTTGTGAQSKSFQLGAGQDSSKKESQGQAPKESATSTETGSSKEKKITFKMNDGDKWIVSSDGRSHYVPAGKESDKDSAGQLALLTNGKEADAEFIKELIAKASPPSTPEDYIALRKELGKMTQIDLHDYVREFPVESGYMIRYLAGMEPDLLPEFTESSVEENIAYCVKNTWNAMYALLWAVRKEKVLEVN